MLKEFKAFAMRGNVIDLAVGIVIGTAFGKVVSSLVNDIVMPPIGVLIGGVDFSNLSWVLVESGDGVLTTVNYGLFINTIIDFIIISVAIFFVIKAMSKIKKEEIAPEATEKKCPECLSNIPIAATKCKFCTSGL